jgi:hypothetical protein
MKLNMLWQFVVGKPIVKTNEVEIFAWVSILLGLVAFTTILLWDWIVGPHIAHNEGYGYLQILALAGIGLYVLFGVFISQRWGE